MPAHEDKEKCQHLLGIYSYLEQNFKIIIVEAETPMRRMCQRRRL